MISLMSAFPPSPGGRAGRAGNPYCILSNAKGGEIGEAVCAIFSQICANSWPKGHFMLILGVLRKF